MGRIDPDKLSGKSRETLLAYRGGVHGAGDHLSIGERIAFYRARRGFTQAVLAARVGRSEDLISKVERGERSIRRIDLLVELARVLRVSLGDLIGEPVLVETPEANHDNVPAVRDALMAPSRLSQELFADTDQGRPANLEQVHTLTESAWDDYQAGRLGRIIATLPFLIRAAQSAERTGKGRAWALSARVHHLAATALSKVGEADLAWIAAERSMQAADQADDPLVLGSAARAGTHALLSIGRYDDALELGRTARKWLAARVRQDDPEALSLLGMLDLRMAIAAARRQDRQTAAELLDSAATAAAALGRDANYWRTAFGPTNVMLHRISAALDLGDVTYVVEHGARIDPSPLPVERQVCHLVDLARAHSELAHDDIAVSYLLAAEEQAGEFVRHNPMVRETVRAIHRRAPATMRDRQSEVAAFAERCRAIA